MNFSNKINQFKDPFAIPNKEIVVYSTPNTVIEENTLLMIMFLIRAFQMKEVLTSPSNKFIRKMIDGKSALLHWRKKKSLNG